MMKFVPFSDNIEGFINKFGLVFTLLVVYGGIDQTFK